MFAYGPMVASPTYDWWGTFAPSPIWAFLVSTNVPTLAPAASRLPGRREAYGPTCAPGPIEEATAWARTTLAPAPTSVSMRDTSGPMVAPSPTAVLPRSWVFWSMTASRPTTAVT